MITAWRHTKKRGLAFVVVCFRNVLKINFWCFFVLYFALHYFFFDFIFLMFSFLILTNNWIGGCIGVTFFANFELFYLLFEFAVNIYLANLNIILLQNCLLIIMEILRRSPHLCSKIFFLTPILLVQRIAQQVNSECDYCRLQLTKIYTEGTKFLYFWQEYIRNIFKASKK